jgi:hypothetical protein
MVFFVWHRTRSLRYFAKRSAAWTRPAASIGPAFGGCVSGLTKSQVEDLLDWLEATGRRPEKVDYKPEEGFSVYYS